MKIVAPIIGILGIALAAIAFFSWRDYSRFTVTTDGVVSKRTPTYCAIRLEGPIPRGGASVELPYSAISGTGSDAPPEDGREFNLGDKVTLIHPPGQPSEARLKDGFGPTVPSWLGGSGIVLIVASIGLFAMEGKRPAKTAG